jgi:outer membrane protein assembly factor BamB
MEDVMGVRGWLSAAAIAVAALVMAAPATAAPGVTFTPLVASPTIAVTVSGAGFAANEGIDVFFDTTDVALAGTDSTGAFGGITIHVPVDAVPGTHWISLEGRHSGLFAQKAFTVRTDWVQYKWTAAHRGTNPYENVISAANVSGLELAWKGVTGGTDVSSPIVVGGRVYIGSSDHNLYVFSTSTHALLWKGTTGGTIRSSPAAYGNYVYVGSSDNKLDAFPVAGCGTPTCAPAWTVTLDGSPNVSAPAVFNAVVYIGTQNGTVYAISGPTHGILWIGKPDPASKIEASPVVDNGSVYVAESDIPHKVYEFPVGCRSDGGMCSPTAATSDFTLPVAGTPAASGGRLVVPLLGEDRLYVLDEGTLSTSWSVFTGTLQDIESPAIAKGIVYMGNSSSVDPNLWAHSLASPQQVVWQSSVGNDAFDNAPAVANGVVFAVGDLTRAVYAFPAACSTPCAPLWSAAAAPATSSVVVSDGVVYVGTATGFSAFDLPSAANAPPRPALWELVPDWSLRPSG